MVPIMWAIATGSARSSRVRRLPKNSPLGAINGALTTRPLI